MFQFLFKIILFHFILRPILIYCLLKFLAPAHIVEKHRNQTARLGSKASLRCEAKGDNPLIISWRRAGSSLGLEPTVTDYRYMIKVMNTSDGAVSTLELLSTTREDSGRYFCMASNSYGRDEVTIHLYIQGTAIPKYH